MIYISNELNHHGIKGMRWGIRKQENIAKQRGYTRNYLGGAEESSNHPFRYDNKDKQVYKRIKKSGGLYQKSVTSKIKNGHSYTTSYMTKSGKNVSYKDAQAYLRVSDTKFLRTAAATFIGMYGAAFAAAGIGLLLHK